MKIYKNLNIKKRHKNGVIAIGNFDGVHLGHQKVILEAKRMAKISEKPSKKPCAKGKTIKFLS